MRGVNTKQSRPATGVIDVMAIRYAEVNQLTLAKASSSFAIGDCIVVKRDMLDVKMKTSMKSDTMIRIPRVRESGTDCVLSAWVSVLEQSEVGRSDDRSDATIVLDVMVSSLRNIY